MENEKAERIQSIIIKHLYINTFNQNNTYRTNPKFPTFQYSIHLIITDLATVTNFYAVPIRNIEYTYSKWITV